MITAAAVQTIVRKHRRPFIITSSVILLQLVFGFDPKFCAMNINRLFE